MKKYILLLLSSLMIFSLTACQKAATPSDTPDEDAIIQNATEYFEQMRSGDFEAIYNALPDGVKQQTKSAQTIQDSWDEAVTKTGGQRTGSVLLSPGAYGANTSRVRNSL